MGDSYDDYCDKIDSLPDIADSWRCPVCGDDADGCYCDEDAEPIDGGEEG